MDESTLLDKDHEHDPPCTVMKPQSNVDVDTIHALLHNWLKTGFPQDQDDIQKAEHLDKIYRMKLSPSADLEETREHPRSAARLCKSLRDVLPVISGFKHALEKELELAENRLKNMTLMCGIALLSDDLLSIIFDHVVEKEKSRDRAALILSGVNRRFRSLALSTSSLWSTIRGAAKYSASMQKKNSMFLDRSGAFPLNVTFDVNSRKNLDANVSRFMKDLLPHSDRWKEFHLVFGGGKTCVYRFFECLEKLGFHRLHLPNLERLSISCNFFVQSWFDDDLETYLCWSAPNLRSLELKDFTIDLSKHTSLTHISIAMHTDRFSFEWIRRLEGLPYLQSLYIGLNCSMSKLSTNIGVTLSSISHLSLYIFVASRISHHKILSSLSCPNLEHLSIELSVDRTLYVSGTAIAYVRQCYSSLLGNPTERYPRLSHLQLKVQGTPERENATFGHAISELPLNGPLRITRIAVSYTVALPKMQQADSDGYPPPLKVVIVQSPQPEKLYDWLWEVFNTMSINGVMKQFEHLIIRRKDEVSGTVTPSIIHRDVIFPWLSKEIDQRTTPRREGVPVTRR
ncbi:hypothetical protein SCHPADRAFT_984098 [Schizopora paradoxa]|uniref:F-box domain-containing protein n=1 Tax=Schizopora paradoxa TaxID=27342 RepID=A0A0H2RRH6_9AGAM|nr:hypothetical protein SCHPADRAFT_984098 [Schizopora paradoxa]